MQIYNSNSLSVLARQLHPQHSPPLQASCKLPVTAGDWLAGAHFRDEACPTPLCSSETPSHDVCDPKAELTMAGFYSSVGYAPLIAEED